MTTREVLKILKADGWYKVGQVGSHIQLKNDTKKGKVTVSDHKGDIHPKTLNSILKQAGLK